MCIRASRALNPDVLAIRAAAPDAKAMLLLADPERFFPEPHSDGYPAVLVRLAAVGRAELSRLLEKAWAALAPKALLAKSKPVTRRCG